LSLIPKQRFSFQLGIESNASRAKSARQTCGSRYRKFTPRVQLLRKKPKEPFDCITLVDSKITGVTEDWLGRFQLLSSLLKKDGNFILVVPNYDNPWVKKTDTQLPGHRLRLHFNDLETELATLYPGL